LLSGSFLFLLTYLSNLTISTAVGEFKKSAYPLGFISLVFIVLLVLIPALLDLLSAYYIDKQKEIGRVLGRVAAFLGILPGQSTFLMVITTTAVLTFIEKLLGFVPGLFAAIFSIGTWVIFWIGFMVVFVVLDPDIAKKYFER